MQRLFLLLATLALTITTSAALTLPLTRNTSLALLTPTNITSSALEPPADLDNSVKSLSWPKLPYEIALDGTGYTGVRLNIHSAKPFHTSPMINVHDLQLFLREFADKFRREYPVPGFMPREASEYTIDVRSFTRWTILIKEGVFHGRLPTAVALVALDTLEKELGKHGPAEIVYGILITGHRGAWSIGTINLETLTEASLADSLSNEDDNLHTA